MPARYRQNWNAALKRLLDDPLLCVIGPTPAPAGLHHVQATNTRKHIAAYLIHARAMGRLHQTDNAAAIGGVLHIDRHRRSKSERLSAHHALSRQGDPQATLTKMGAEQR